MRCRRERFEQGASRVEHPARESTSFACNADRGVHAGNPEGMNLSVCMAALSFGPIRIFVGEAVDQLTEYSQARASVKRSPKRTANWFIAAFQS